MARPHRLGREEYIGVRRYSLTTCAHERACHFVDPAVISMVLLQFLQVAAEELFEIIVYCFMPDHVHAVVAGTSATADFQRFVRIAKQRPGFLFRQTTGLRLWQDGYFERVVRSDASLPALVAYIVMNPVRAGLVRTPAEYPYWGSQTYTRSEILEFVGRLSRV